MASVSRLAILGCVAAVARAQFVKRGTETESWRPARETDGSNNLDPLGWTPKPTSAPEANAVEKELRRRDGTSTCGYYSGYSSSPSLTIPNVSHIRMTTTTPCTPDTAPSAAAIKRPSTRSSITLPSWAAH
ncbi:hypothetical protein G7054_g14938 [Neopestalotiopsis clavispora]|nr:hypothetical protein G7054_g14938 [Neopestalotiopsis clavispora]